MQENINLKQIHTLILIHKITAYLLVLKCLKRITEITDALNGKTIFAYDKNGNLLTVTDAKAQTITYTYTVRDKVATMTDQLNKVETYSYDRMDNLVSITDRKGQITTYTYNLLNQLTKTVIPVQTGIQDYITYQYDAIGRMNYINDSISGPIEYVYSNTGCSACGSTAVDKVIQEITPLGLISYEYNALGWRTKATIAGQEPVYYNYDAVGRLISLSQGDKVVTFAYDAIGRRTSMVLPNGVVAAYNYDAASRLLNITYFSGSQVIKSIDYTYDKNGSRMSAKGHQTLMPETFTATYNSANQMMTFNGQSLLYDENGNLILKGDTTYQWDVRNRLTAITSPSYNASFKYDPFGRRIEKTINGKTTDYLYDGLDIVQEIENGTVSTNYLRGLNIDETLGIQRQDNVYYYLTDALGSTIALTDPSRNIATEYYYDPFGNTQTSNPNIYNPFQYTGRENDGNGYYGYRLREKLGERFISQDPVGFMGGINFYSFVSNRPTMFIDPLGLKCKKSFLSRVWENFLLTNKTIPGVLAPAIIPGVGTGLLTGGKVAELVGGITLRQWAMLGFRGATLQGVAFTGLETGVITAGTAATNFALIGAAWEAGVGIGSIISAAILPCEEEIEPPKSKGCK